MDKKLILIIGIIAVIVIIIIFLATGSIKKRNRLAILDQLQDRIGTLKALPIQYLLNKVSLMSKSIEVEEKYEEWLKTYEFLSNDENRRIKNEITEIETMIYSRKYQKSLERLHTLQDDIANYETAYENILDELTNATQVDVKNREEITNQKELFRNYKKMYQSNYNSYKPYNNAIERYFVNIEDSFTNIDVLLNQSQVDKARNKGASLEGELLKMKDILNNLPVVLEELTKEIPAKFKEVEYHYNEVVLKKYNLQQLNIPERLSNINNEIVTLLSKNNDVFLKDLQDTSHQVNQELDAINSELDEEVRANEQLERLVEDLVANCHEADKLCKELNKEVDDIKHHYVLSKNEEANLAMETKVLFNFLVEKNDIVSQHLSSNYVATELDNKARLLLPKVQGMSIALKAYQRRLNEMRQDEKRLYDEYYNMLYIIKDCESRLRLMNLPMLAQAYFDTIEEAKHGLNGVLKLLDEKPLNITLINTEVSLVIDVVYKLYDNARNLLKTAQMAENTIVFGNRYRSSKPEIEAMLARAELFFNNGEYTKSLSTAIEAIETIYPSIRKELLKYKTEQLKATPME
ncbi:septation ring formation regulator EzrA [Erysipelotrichaceae bacterium OttesenSCG-928-M19]|nr:septation ring formation regulator EzrA [Erysipelotrichaceae bacterium OttesenSCG-928-M19]